MGSLSFFRKANLVVGTFVLLAINAVGALPRKYIDPIAYKSAQHQVGPDIASVYLPDSDSREPLTPVQTFVTDGPLPGFKDTGQRVLVYVRSGYKDNIIAFYPRITLLLVAAMLSIHLVLSRLMRRRSA